MESHEAVVLDRVVTERGELVLRQLGADFEVISNGVFLMDTRNGESERLLVTAALDAAALVTADPDVAGATDAHVLLGGLGVGYSLLEALRDPRVAHVTVVEVEPAVVAWHRGPLRVVTSGALDDPRVHVVVDDLRHWLETTSERYDAICVDTDNGPGWTVYPDNARLYDDGALALLRGRLRPDGALSVWSAAAAPEFAAHLCREFGGVTAINVPVPRGEDDVVYVVQLPAGTTP